MPHLVAMALQADGWVLRQTIIWEKPNPMPESVTDRCTKAHEYVFLLTKQPRYYYDAEAVREEQVKGSPGSRFDQGKTGDRDGGDRTQEGYRDFAGRNRRSVWNIPTQGFPGRHFAVFPERLVELCLRSSCSSKGCCPACGAQFARVLDSEPLTRERPNALTKRQREPGTGNACPNTAAGVATRTIGWRPTCTCNPPDVILPDGSLTGCPGPYDPIPPTVLDPYLGSGTTLLVARKMGFSGIGIELNEEYAAMAEARLREPLAKPTIKQPASMPGQKELFT